MTRRCRTCGEEKSLSLFTLRKDGVLGRSTQCRECKNTAERNRYREDPSYHRDYAKRTAEERINYDRRYYLANKKRLSEQKKIYRAENPEIKRVSNAKRHAVKLRAQPFWADELAIREVYVECERLNKQTGINHHVDHIVPLQGKTVCGLHVHNNLQVLRDVENLSKLNRFWPDMPE